MHELSICNSMLAIVRHHAVGRQVRTVHVRIGQLRQIVPDTLAYCWSLVTEGSELAGTELRIERVSAKIRCGDCGREQVLSAPLLHCATSTEHAVELLAGDEFLITSLELAGV
ncbi:hydrogenase maturation nickel metallochaperone HypA [Mycobacterium sp. SM1]|uniref:hydrogenase maturation nickel metallochaperone HypA n=1 Tax=Mycobacterium sp. SM1 TaxID=2816243 RepID=UPI001BCE0C2F|nr:hydrogenase maturation nickel metallochaperone HypA [Mycobacterium sp. SM1]MBS4727594.1 hydrogenase maturation nickel metallochaperone HypA [Mycobacterium sp. SM1]